EEEAGQRVALDAVRPRTGTGHKAHRVRPVCLRVPKEKGAHRYRGGREQGSPQDGQPAPTIEQRPGTRPERDGHTRQEKECERLEGEGDPERERGEPRLAPRPGEHPQRERGQEQDVIATLRKVEEGVEEERAEGDIPQIPAPGKPEEATAGGQRGEDEDDAEVEGDGEQAG